MTASGRACVECGSSGLVEVPTFKRNWFLCEACGCGFPEQRERYPWMSLLPWPEFKERQDHDASSIYDYFVREDHIQYSIDTAHEFLGRYIDPLGIEVEGRRVLDVSGGNGHFLNEFVERGAVGTLTEYNDAAVAHAKANLEMSCATFDFASDRINEVCKGPFDLVMARAAIMFCADLGAFARDLAEIVVDGGQVIVNHSVVPSLGVLVRVQLDEFSYAVLRQPETVIGHFEAAGFECEHRFDETDPSLYAYDHDLNRYQMLAHYRFEIPAARKLRDHWKWAFPARDRRRSTMIFRRSG